LLYYIIKMFQSNDNQQFVATRNVSIKPESIIPYGPTANNPKFLIPQSLGFIDPSSLFLKYNIKFSGRGCWQPDTAAGALSLWRDCRIQTGDGRTTIEDLQDMNVKTGHDWNLNQNDSINNRRALYEGRQPRNSYKDSQLYFSTPTANPSSDKDAYELIQLQHGLPQSGILGPSARVFPVLATQGLRVSLTIENLERSITAWTAQQSVGHNTGSGLAVVITDPEGTDVGWQSFGSGYWSKNSSQEADWVGLYGAVGGAADAGAGLVAATAGNGEIVAPGTAVAEQQIVLNNKNDAVCPVNQDGSLRDAGAGEVGKRPFSVGDIIFVGTVPDPAAKNSANGAQMLGVVSGFDEDTTAGESRAVIKYYPFGFNRAGAGGAFPLSRNYPTGSAIFTSTASRLISNIYVNPNIRADAVPANLQEVKGLTYEITDLELVVNQVSPPESYVNSLTKQIASGVGLNIDYKTLTMYRHNQETLNGLTNQLIPAVQSRAYSVTSIPLDSTVQRNQQDMRSSIRGIVDGIQNYQYVVGSSMQPNRPVDTIRYNSQGLEPKFEPLHMMELEKATIASGIPVRSWWDLPADFSVGRAFALNGQVHDLNGIDLSLRAEYQNGGKPKLFQHYICHMNTLTITNDMTSVVR